MKYIKLFETVEYSIRSEGDKHITYEFEIDGYNFVCHFDLNRSPNIWRRNYRTKEKGQDLVNINAFKIMSTLSDITAGFLEKFKPNGLTINHLTTDDEIRGSSYSLNRRASMNYRSLKNKISNDYDIEYYSGFDVLCFIKKKGLNHDLMDPKFKIKLN
jgi:hypothetical protein